MLLCLLVIIVSLNLHTAISLAGYERIRGDS